MLEGREAYQNRSCNTSKFDDREFYNAIRDEDLGRMEEMTKKYGSNYLLKMQETPGVFCKARAARPLHLAATYRRVKSMQSLLSAGADPEMRDGLGQTTLHLLITSWPSDKTTWQKPGSKLFNEAEACLRLLCEHGVNVNAEVDGKIHQTALHLSVRCAALSAIHILASYGADVNAADSNGMTPLHMAAGILHKDIIASLVREGADINMGVKDSGNTPLHIAAVATAMKTTKTLEDSSGCISELVKHGAQVNATNKAGLTPLQEACTIGDNELVDLLLRYGANIDELSKAGENCLFLFLSRRPNLTKNSLLVKLFSLISPLTVYNHKGLLPATLNRPCFFKQRQQLLKLIQQPRRLQDICKRVIYLKCVQDKRDELRKVLPESVYNFVFNYWEDLHISFETDSDGDRDSLTSLTDMAPV
ncbi:ankyrin repeat domain-containing protein 61-like isoform X1 [Acanthopagrus latus]|uniref:ankyrin repeat domain-containing protein 61-like isoform X1 n=2 Tax=Acanthopagrus latus TaxID=8177 RepID=UPI00187BD051|nr:ankyrin repeat domain-containing protein 61-like isoform X1 [Acanthopagrus latus]